MVAVSTTHSIVGAAGFGLVTQGVLGIKWQEIFYMLISWVSTPCVSDFGLVLF